MNKLFTEPIQKLKDWRYELRMEWKIQSRKYKAIFKRWKDKTFGIRRVVLKEILYGDRTSPGYYKQLETSKILEMWIAKRIQDGFPQRRQELVQKQNEIKELELFIEYLENLRK